MALIPGILPPSLETYKTVTYLFQFFPLVTAVQWVTDWYPVGKTSTQSRLNLPGKLAWALMETPGLLIVGYSIFALPAQLGVADRLAWGNYTMAGLYCIHYVYRAYAFAWLAPSIAPIHIIPFLGACAFNIFNGISIAGWTGGYGPITVDDWAGALYRLEIGMVIWGWSLLAVIFHDDDLREIRRAASRMQKAKEGENKKGAKKDVTSGPDRVYMIPKNGLFKFIFYPHYLCEWLEWTGFWVIGGWDCVPARTFVINEISTMLPRALAGRRWYIEKFGKEKIGGRKAIIPGIL